MSENQTAGPPEKETGSACHSATRQNFRNTNANSDTASPGAGQASLDIEAIERIFANHPGYRMISPTLDRGWPSRQPAHVLPEISRNQVVSCGREYKEMKLFWADARTGACGEGAISLVAHVLKIPASEAAARLWRHAALAFATSPEKLAAELRRAA